MLRGLHKLCDKSQWEDALAALQDDSPDGVAVRESAKKPGGWGEWTPLHLACKREPPAELVAELLRAAPSAAETFDLHNRLPIHYVAEHGTKIETLEALVLASPESVTGVDAEARTPLHLAFLFANRAYSAGESVRPVPNAREVALLLDEDSAAAWTADEAGFLPVHYAAAVVDDCDVETFEVLVDADVRTLVTQNDEGLTPLHMALLQCSEKPISLDVLKLLLGKGDREVYDEVGKLVDHAGRTALHCACQNYDQIPLECLEELINSYPGATFVEASDQGYPIEVLEGTRETETGTLDGVDFLAMSDMLFCINPDVEPFSRDSERLERFGEKIKKEITETGKLSEGSHIVWVWMCSMSPEQDKDNLYFKQVQTILLSIEEQKTRRTLVCVDTTTLNGSKLPLYECASKRFRPLLFEHLRFVDRYEFNYRDILADKTETSISLRAFDYDQPEELRKVKVTFMSDAGAFAREIKLRQMIQLHDTSDTDGKSPAVVPLVDFYDMKRIGTPDERPGDVKFARDLPNADKDEKIPYFLGMFPHAIVTQDFGQDVASLLPGVDEPIKACTKAVKTYFQSIGESLHRIHTSGIVNNDVTTTNMVRLASGQISAKHLDYARIMANKGESSKEFHGSSTTLRTSNLMPEMIAKLSADEVVCYEAYWKEVMDDATVASFLREDDIKVVTARVDEMLGEDSLISQLWERISNHAKLWKKIRPRKIGEEFFVVKCFEEDRSTLTPMSMEGLPYELLPADKRQDIWSFGVMLYDFVTGSPLFKTDCASDLCEDIDFQTLYSAGFSEVALHNRLELVEDSVARDLLRSIFSHTDRPKDMEEVLEHPFFCADVGQSRKDRRLVTAVVRREKQLADQKEAEHQAMLLENKHKEWLRQRSTNVVSASRDVALKFDRSVWSQLKVLNTTTETSFPTAMVLLPYELQLSEGTLTVPADHENLSFQFGRTVASLLHSTALAGVLCQGDVDAIALDADLISEFFDQGQFITSVGNNIVDICDSIVKRFDIAESILSSILEHFVLDSSAATEANKLVQDAIAHFVDVDICKIVIAKAAKVETAFGSLLQYAGGDEHQMSRRVVAEQLEQFIVDDATGDRATRLHEIESALLELVTAFLENPALAAKDIVKRDLQALLRMYDTSETSKLYLVDEFTGVPVASSYPKSLDLSLENLKMVLPCMMSAVKATCASNIPLGLATVLGIPREKMPEEWSLLSSMRVGGFDRQAVVHELQVIVEALEENPEINILESDFILGDLKTFLGSVDEEKDYGGLRRLCGLNDKIMWSGYLDGDGCGNKAVADVIDFAAAESAKKSEEFAHLMKSFAKPKESSTKSLNLWCHRDNTTEKESVAFTSIESAGTDWKSKAQVAAAANMPVQASSFLTNSSKLKLLLEASMLAKSDETTIDSQETLTKKTEGSGLARKAVPRKGIHALKMKAEPTVVLKPPIGIAKADDRNDTTVQRREEAQLARDPPALGPKTTPMWEPKTTTTESDEWKKKMQAPPLTQSKVTLPTIRARPPAIGTKPHQLGQDNSVSVLSTMMMVKSPKSGVIRKAEEPQSPGGNFAKVDRRMFTRSRSAYKFEDDNPIDDVATSNADATGDSVSTYSDQENNPVVNGSSRDHLLKRFRNTQPSQSGEGLKPEADAPKFEI